MFVVIHGVLIYLLVHIAPESQTGNNVLKRKTFSLALIIQSERKLREESQRIVINL